LDDSQSLLSECETKKKDFIVSFVRWDSEDPKTSFEGLWIDGAIVLGLYAHTYDGKEVYAYGGELKDKRGCGKGVTVFPTGGVCEGEFLNGELHGYGSLEYKEEDIYTGMWKNNVKHGYGEYVWSSGNTYRGQWVENRREGANGTLLWSNGDEYCGDWLDNKRTGNGVLRWSNVRGGGVYTGQFFDNMLHGHGKFSFRGLIYDGPWLEDRREGMGELRWEEDGSCYRGEWKQGARVGVGHLHLPNGDKIEQEWNEPENIKYSQSTPLKFVKQQHSSRQDRQIRIC